MGKTIAKVLHAGDGRSGFLEAWDIAHGRRVESRGDLVIEHPMSARALVRHCIDTRAKMSIATSSLDVSERCLVTMCS